jgi:hypothetical protein
MVFRPRAGKLPVLRGRFAFSARHGDRGVVEDVFDLEIEIPDDFPGEVPVVTETGGRIPRQADYHVNNDGTFCLGSPLRLRQLLASAPTLTGFAGNSLVPYLFAQSQKLAGTGGFAFGELAHGLPGMLDDYVALFGVKKYWQAVETLRLLGLKKRRANKLLCPCGCQQRLGRCRFNTKLAEFRKVASRNWFRAERETILETVKRITERIGEAENQLKRPPRSLSIAALL